MDIYLHFASFFFLEFVDGFGIMEVFNGIFDTGVVSIFGEVLETIFLEIYESHNWKCYALSKLFQKFWSIRFNISRERVNFVLLNVVWLNMNLLETCLYMQLHVFSIIWERFRISKILEEMSTMYCIYWLVDHGQIVVLT